MTRPPTPWRWLCAFVFSGPYQIGLVPDPDISSATSQTSVELYPGRPVALIRVLRVPSRSSKERQY